MSTVKSFRDLIAWQKGMDLVVTVYGAIRSFPRHEIYALSQQVRKAVISVPANIAEGWGRGSLGDYLRFLKISRGSLYELVTELIAAQRLNYMTLEAAGAVLSDCDECGKVLQGLVSSVERIWESQNPGKTHDWTPGPRQPDA